MRYLTVEDVLGFNEWFVGRGQLRDLGLLEAAVIRPQQALVSGELYPNLPSKAAALVHSLIGNPRSSMATSAQPWRPPWFSTT